jgi:hypothetical protein
LQRTRKISALNEKCTIWDAPFVPDEICLRTARFYRAIAVLAKKLKTIPIQ